VALHSAIADAMLEAGDAIGFRAHRIAVETFEAIATAPQHRSALALFNLATFYYMKGDNASALPWYERTLEVDANLAIAY
jgi:hypothetical protein